MDFLVHYKYIILVFVVVLAGIILAGKKNAKVFIENNLRTLEREAIKAVASNPTLYAKIIYGKLPKGLKLFTNISTIEKVVAKFIDK